MLFLSVHLTDKIVKCFNKINGSDTPPGGRKTETGALLVSSRKFQDFSKGKKFERGDV